MLLVSWNFYTIKKGFTSFIAENLRSIGQRAAKLLAVNIRGLKKKSASQPRPLLNQSARVRTRAKSNHSQSLMAGNFAALWSIGPKFSAFKDLMFFSTVSKAQEASSILKVGFALSNWPHFYSLFSNRFKWSSIAVYVREVISIKIIEFYFNSLSLFDIWVGIVFRYRLFNYLHKTHQKKLRKVVL